MTQKMIAFEFGISISTFGNLAANAYKKLGVHGAAAAVFAHRSKSPSSTCSSPSGARRSRNEALGASTPDGSGHHILAGHPKGTGILVGRLQDSEGLFHECLPAAARFEHGLAGERYRVVPALDLQVLPS